eukprot:Gb_35584 [translate_table: standard]
MQTLMEGYCVWTIAKGDEAKPDAAVGATTAQIQDWDKRENKAKVLLRMSIKDSIIPHIREAQTSAEMWTMLKDLYETSNTNHILFLKTKLLGGCIKEVKDKLGHIGETVSSTDLVTITLNEEERHTNLNPQNSDLALWSNKRSLRGRSGERGRGGSLSQKMTISKAESRYAI